MKLKAKTKLIYHYRDYKKFDDDINNFTFDQFDVSSFKKQYLIYLINMLQSNKNTLQQMKPLL